MITFIIYILTALNIMTSAYLFPRYMDRRAIFQLTFILVWTLEYVIGNILVLISQDVTFILVPFSEFERSYALSLLAGQYFIWAYISLLDGGRVRLSGSLKMRAGALTYINIFWLMSIVFAAAFAYNLGPSLLLFGESGNYRINLNDLSEGIGIYYYLALSLISATLLLGGYANDYPNARTLSLFLIAFLLVGFVFGPLGGRGRLLNILMILALTYVLSDTKSKLTRFFKIRTIVLAATIIALGLVWGTIRDGERTQEVSISTEQAIAALAIDTTRLPNQAFIFDTFSVTGSISGLHYIESLVGPFYKYTTLEPNDLIKKYSALWYATTVGTASVNSAVSPSLIGEAYINFGIIGVLLSPLILFTVISVMRRLACEHPLAISVIIYFFQFNAFHGGLYLLFDMLVYVIPVILISRALTVTLQKRPRTPEFR